MDITDKETCLNMHGLTHTHTKRRGGGGEWWRWLEVRPLERIMFLKYPKGRK